ncbi:hypothetical protein BATR1942_20130 [Bacillus atrophaeus 1942]|uniref:Uncharacterized protein n=1 Tax=Bacillus atrophaeus (strain 1942) TaxID=720555 RepID=A0ABN3ZMH0_BACA1|nr:hypothetical protein BATR1942_20130 [Bacillus atrophaeus 1942]
MNAFAPFSRLQTAGKGLALDQVRELQFTRQGKKVLEKVSSV